VFGTLINLRIVAQTSAGTPSGLEVSQDDINNLLSPEKVHGLSPELWSELKHVLQNSLHTLFIVMAVLAVAGVLSVFGLRNRAPQAAEEDHA